MLTFGVVSSGALRPHPVRSDLKKRDHTRTPKPQNHRTQKPQNQRSQIRFRHGLSRWSPTMTSFLKGQNRPITVCHGSSRPGMLGSWDFMVLSSDNDTGIVYTFQVPQSVIRQRLQITRSIEMYAYPEIISICDLCVVMDRQGYNHIIIYHYHQQQQQQQSWAVTDLNNSCQGVGVQLQSFPIQSIMSYNKTWLSVGYKPPVSGIVRKCSMIFYTSPAHPAIIRIRATLQSRPQQRSIESEGFARPKPEIGGKPK